MPALSEAYAVAALATQRHALANEVELSCLATLKEADHVEEWMLHVEGASEQEHTETRELLTKVRASAHKMLTQVHVWRETGEKPVND